MPHLPLNRQCRSVELNRLFGQTQQWLYRCVQETRSRHNCTVDKEIAQEASWLVGTSNEYQIVRIPNQYVICTFRFEIAVWMRGNACFLLYFSCMWGTVQMIFSSGVVKSLFKSRSLSLSSLSTTSLIDQEYLMFSFGFSFKLVVQLTVIEVLIYFDWFVVYCVCLSSLYGS